MLKQQNVLLGAVLRGVVCLGFFHFSVHSTFLWALQAFLKILSADFLSALPGSLRLCPEQCIDHCEGAERQTPKSLFLELSIILLKSDGFTPQAFLFQQSNFKPTESLQLASLCVVCLGVWSSFQRSWSHEFLPRQISVLTVADAVRTCSLDQCYKTFLSPATSETKRKMSSFVSSIKASDSSTQHALGFQKAFQLLRNTNNGTRLQGSKAASCASLMTSGPCQCFLLSHSHFGRSQDSGVCWMLTEMCSIPCFYFREHFLGLQSTWGTVGCVRSLAALPFFWIERGKWSLW